MTEKTLHLFKDCLRILSSKYKLELQPIRNLSGAEYGYDNIHLASILCDHREYFLEMMNNHLLNSKQFILFVNNDEQTNGVYAIKTKNHQTTYFQELVSIKSCNISLEG